MSGCDAESGGYTCDREAGHGDIHHDPKHGSDQYCNLWILEPHGEDEYYGRKPMSGYQLLTDSLSLAAGRRAQR